MIFKKGKIFQVGKKPTVYHQVLEIPLRVEKAHSKNSLENCTGWGLFGLENGVEKNNLRTLDKTLTLRSAKV